MDDLFGDIETLKAGMSEDTKEKMDAVVTFHQNLDGLSGNVLMALTNADFGDGGELEQLDKAYEMLAKDLEELREKLFGKKEIGPVN